MARACNCGGLGWDSRPFLIGFRLSSDLNLPPFEDHKGWSTRKPMSLWRSSSGAIGLRPRNFCVAPGLELPRNPIHSRKPLFSLHSFDRASRFGRALRTGGKSTFLWGDVAAQGGIVPGCGRAVYDRHPDHRQSEGRRGKNHHRH